jgi:hypothetical protein
MRRPTRRILYCLALAAARYEIELILPSAMSNHHHGVLYDRHGREVEFRELLPRLDRAGDELAARAV